MLPFMETVGKRRGRGSSGFTRIELVAVIGCAVTLVILAFAAMEVPGHLRERAILTRCRANQRQIFQALQLYANDNKNLLPDCTPANQRFYGAAWPWDIHTNLAADLGRRGVSREMFYCPANPGMNDDTHWDFSRDQQTPIRVIGYLLLLNGSMVVPKQFWHKDFKGDGSTPPAESELITDATAAINGDFTTITGVFTDRSSHMNGANPLGGNITFLDGHVAWRDSRDMQQRFTTGPGVAWYY